MYERFLLKVLFCYRVNLLTSLLTHKLFFSDMFFVVVGGWVTFLILSPLLQLASVASIKEVASTPPSWNCQVPKVSQPIRAVLVSIDQSEQLSRVNQPIRVVLMSIDQSEQLSRVNQPIKVVLMSIDQSEQLSLVNRPIRAALTSIDKSEQFSHISRVVEPVQS